MPREPRNTSTPSSMPSAIRGHCMYINPLSLDGRPCGRQLKREEDVARHVLIHVRKEVAYMNAGGRITQPLVHASREQLVSIGVPPQSVSRAQRYISKEFPASGVRGNTHSPAATDTGSPSGPGETACDIGICATSGTSYLPACFPRRDVPCFGGVVPQCPGSVESSILSLSPGVTYGDAIIATPESFHLHSPDYGTVPMRSSFDWPQPLNSCNEHVPIVYEPVAGHCAQSGQQTHYNSLYLSAMTIEDEQNRYQALWR